MQQPETPSVRDQIGTILYDYIRATDKIRDKARGDQSTVRLLNALIENPMNASRDAPREWATSNKIAERVGRQPQPGCAFLPVGAHRDLTAASASGGGYLVDTITAPNDVFVSALLAASITRALGVQELPIDRGNGLLPTGIAASTAYWLTTEGTAITESSPTFGQTAAEPHTVGVYCELSGKFLRQISPAAENFVLSEMARVVAAGVDLATINGSGSNGEPLGLLGSGIATESGASVTWAKVCEAIGDVETANGVVNPAATGWAIAPDAAEILRKREKATGLGFIMARGEIDGRPAFVSNSVPAGTAVFGDWSGILMPTWGTLEIGVNSADSGSTLFKTGAVSVRALWTVDVAVMRPASFVSVTSIT